MEKRYQTLLILLVILSISLTFRIWNLETIPHWYWDEGVNMNIAWNLANGKMQWFCIRYAFVPHPPLFFIIAGIALKLFGNELLVLRGLTALYGVLTTLILYFVGRDLFDRRMGLLTSLLYAVYPTAIYFNRMAFANNQVMFFSVLTMYFLIRYLKEKRWIWFYLLSISAGLSVITEIMGFGVLFSIIVLFWVYDRGNVPKVSLISVSFFAIFVGSMLLITPDAFIHDILHSSGRFSFPVAFSAIAVILFIVFKPSCLEGVYKKILYIYSPIFGEIEKNAPLFYILASLILIIFPPSDELFVIGFDFYWFGLVGFYLMKNQKARNIALTFFLASFLILLGLNRADHMLIPIYPLLCIGLAVLLSSVFDLSQIHLSRKIKNRVKIFFISMLLMLYPVGIILYYDFDAFINKNLLFEEDLEMRRAAADFINSNVSERDVVLADSHLTRMINCKSSVLIQSAAFEGRAIAYMPSNLSKDRFLFNCSYRNAKFIVTVKGIREWAMNQTALVEMMNEIQNWSTNEINNYLIYRNPHID